MMDFGCGNLDLDEVIKCTFGLSKAEFRLFNFFIKNSQGEFSSDDLSKKIGLDKSTIQRGLKKLHAKGLLFRKQINQASGGYIFFYKIKNKQAVREKIFGIIENWSKRVDEELSKW